MFLKVFDGGFHERMCVTVVLVCVEPLKGCSSHHRHLRCSCSRDRGMRKYEGNESMRVRGWKGGQGGGDELSEGSACRSADPRYIGSGGTRQRTQAEEWKKVKPTEDS